MIRDVGPDKTARAAPPVGRGVPALDPLLVDGDAALLDVLLVILAEVVAEVIPPVEGLAGAHAPGIVAVMHLLGRLWRVDVLVVPVEVGAALEGTGVAVWVETVDGPVTVLITKGGRLESLRVELGEKGGDVRFLLMSWRVLPSRRWSCLRALVFVDDFVEHWLFIISR